MKATLRRLGHFLLLVAIAVGGCRCGDEPVGEFRIATFNAGLAPLDVPYAAERAPEVVGALAEQEVDLLCVQEFWQEEDWNALVTATAERLPSTLRLPAEPVEALCSPAEFEPLQVCVDGACPDAAGEDLADCALDSCVVEVSALSDGCANCLVTEVLGGADVDGLRSTCLGTGESGDGAAFIYNGAYDAGILTSAPILEQESLVLPSYLLRTSVEYARVDTPVGELHVFCTHLASAIPQFGYRGDYGSWEGEQAAQIDALIGFIDAKVSGSQPVVVLGDLNTGPGIPDRNIVAEWEAHYDEIMAEGFTNPYAEQDDVACTDCPENTFHSPDSDAKLIDHILVRGFSGRMQTQRFLTDPVTIQVDGEAVETNRSDHFGLVMTMRTP